jgi:uncharacterized membrane protein YgcG
MAFDTPGFKSGWGFNPNGAVKTDASNIGVNTGSAGGYTYTAGADGTQVDQYGQKHQVDAMGNPTTGLTFDTTPGKLDPTRDAWQNDPRYAGVVSYLKQHPTGETQVGQNYRSFDAQGNPTVGPTDNPGAATWGSWGNINDPNSVAAKAWKGLQVQTGTGINADSPYFTADRTTAVATTPQADTTIKPLTNPSNDVYNAMGGALTTPGNAENFYANNLANPNYVSQDANIGEFYDNARRQAQNGINSTMAAQGKYGSSMMGDLTAGANVNLGAQEARDRSDYLLKASGENRALNQLGMSGAQGADAQSLAQIGMLGTLAGSASTQNLGQEKEQWNEVSGTAMPEAEASQFWDSLGINQYVDLTDKSVNAILGSYKSAYDNGQLSIDQARQGLTDTLSVMGKFGGGGGSSGGGGGSSYNYHTSQGSGTP